jgi:hypothetical protein
LYRNSSLSLGGLLLRYWLIVTIVYVPFNDLVPLIDEHGTVPAHECP